MTPQLSPHVAVTTASLLRWLDRLSAKLQEGSDLSLSIESADTLAHSLAAHPELAQQVLAAAATDPEIRLQQWAACSRLAPTSAFVAWLQAVTTSGIVTEDVQRLTSRRLAASDAPHVAWLVTKRWMYSGSFDTFVRSPIGQELVTLAIDAVRAGAYQPISMGFSEHCVATGDRLAEWVEAGLEAGVSLQGLGMTFDRVARAHIDPLIKWRAFCHLSTSWTDLERFGGSAWGRFPDTQRVNWPREVLKVLLTHHPDKDVRLGVLQALEPEIPETAAPAIAETPAPPADAASRTRATAAVELLSTVFPRRFR